MEVDENKIQGIARIQSVERAIWILKCFEKHYELSLSEISKMLSLHKSTALGLISTLEAYRLLEKDKKRNRYRLGIELFRLGNRVNVNLKEKSMPYLDYLLNECGETVNLVMPDGDCVIYIEKKESPQSMRIETSLGYREKMYRTATGKAILAKLPLETAKEILERTQFDKLTDNTLMSEEAVLDQLKEIQNRGFAVDNQELVYGLICLGVAIIDSSGAVVGGVSISGPSSRMTQEKQDVFAGYLINCGKQISCLL